MCIRERERDTIYHYDDTVELTFDDVCCFGIACTKSSLIQMKMCVIPFSSVNTKTHQINNARFWNTD